MTLLFAEGFDHYGNANTDPHRKWSYAGLSGGALQTGRISGKCLYGSSTVQLVKNFSTSYTTLVCGIGFKPENSPSNRVILSFMDAGVLQVAVSMQPDNTFRVYRGPSLTGTIIGTGTVALSVGVWYYLEFKSTIHTTTGTYEVRVNGINVLSAINQNTSNTAVNSANGFQVGSINSLPFAVDDVYVCDTAGSVNNNFLGDVQVLGLFPTGAGSNTGFTPSAGANYAAVDDTTPDDDATYVEHATASTRDTYAFGDLAGTVTSVKAVQTCLLARKTDSGAKTLGDSCKSGATTNDGTAIEVAANYSYLTTVRETDPNTAAAWTVANVNAAEFGMKVGA